MPIEQLRAGDLVLSRDEYDPNGPVTAKVIEEVFVRQGVVFHLHVGGQVMVLVNAKASTLCSGNGLEIK